MGVSNWRLAIDAFQKSWRQGTEPPAIALDIEEVRAREGELTRLAQSLKQSELQRHNECLADEQASCERRWESYLLLLTCHRRYKNFSQAMELVRRYKGVLGNRQEDGMFHFLSLHIYSILLKETEDRANIDESVRLARESLELLPGYPGALHNLAGGLWRQANIESVPDSHRKAVLEEALVRVTQALSQEHDYPKYHATKARILSMLGHHDEAEEEIRLAIDSENSQHEDYAIRLSDYLVIKSSVALERTSSCMRAEIAEASRDVLIEARRVNIQILTIFIAVISFLIGGLTLAASFAFDEAAKLIFLLASAILLALIGFSILYEGSVNVLRLVTAITVAGLLLLLAHVVPITIYWG